MTLKSFIDTTGKEKPPKDLSEILVSLWWDRKGEWDNAHSIAQRIMTEQGSAVHAYLHREEGVLWNADYWYRQAGQTRPELSLEEEWEKLVQENLEAQSS